MFGTKDTKDEILSVTKFFDYLGENGLFIATASKEHRVKNSIFVVTISAGEWSYCINLAEFKEAIGCSRGARYVEFSDKE